MGKFWWGKIGEFGKSNLANHELFTIIFLTNIHRYTENVFGISTDCSLFAKFFLAGFYLYGLPNFSSLKFSHVQYVATTYHQVCYCQFFVHLSLYHH